MAKRKYKQPRALNQSPNTRGKVQRKAGFWVKEILTPDGELSVDIDCMDSQVRDGGRQAMFDTIFTMIKFQIVDQCENMKDALGDALKYKEQKETEMMRLATENFQMKQQLEELRKAALNIQTGRGGTTIKSDPFVIRKQLIKILNS